MRALVLTKSRSYNYLRPFLSKNTQKPSLIHILDQLLHVTVLPNHECAISWTATDTPLLSPTIIVGLAKVNNGFSIPPNGKEAGRMTILYLPHLYFPI